MKDIKNIEAPIVDFVIKNTNIELSSFNNILKAHPDYPSFNSIFYTLDHFSIDFDLFETSILEIDKNINNFFAILKDDYGLYYISSIVKKKDVFYSDSSEISYDKLYAGWTNKIIIIHKKASSFKFLNYNKSFFLLTAIFLFGGMVYDQNNLIKNIFICLSMFGLFMSFLSLNIELNFLSSLDSFCSIGIKGECKSVISSKKMKFLNFINFPDVSMSFFLVQLVYLSILPTNFLHSTLWIVLLSFPFVIFSFYYQIFIIKKFCLICTFISLILISEFLLLYFASFFSLDLSFIIKCLALQLMFLYFIHYFRNIKKESSKNLEKLLYKKRYLNNYEIFRKILTNQNKINISHDFLFFDKEKINFYIVTDPFCKHCEKAHDDLISVLSKINDDLYNISVIFNIEKEEENSEDLLLYLSMVNLQMINKNSFLEKLSFWFGNKNVKLWNGEFSQDLSSLKFAEDFLTKQNKWCESIGINKTPTLLINGYMLPDCYDITDLNYIIDELMDEGF